MSEHCMAFNAGLEEKDKRISGDFLNSCFSMRLKYSSFYLDLSTSIHG